MNYKNNYENKLNSMKSMKLIKIYEKSLYFYNKNNNQTILKSQQIYDNQQHEY